MSTVYVVSDTHFNHGNIIKYCDRPFESTTEMDRELIKRWNSVVGKDDKVFHLGDFAWGGKEYIKNILAQLHGHITLIKGNHDTHTPAWYMECGFKEVVSNPIMWSQFVVMSHEPPQFMSDETPYIYLYGHVHDSEMYQTTTKRSACVCVERWNYTPVKIDDLLKLMKINIEEETDED